MKYWILKSEPSVYSFDDLIKDGKTCWDGIRNYQARNNLRAMRVGDLAFFYHSNDGKSVVGLGKIVREAYQDPKTRDDWSAVDLAPLEKLKVPVTLEQMKKDVILKNVSLVKQSRLSVCPVTEAEYKRILELSKG